MQLRCGVEDVINGVALRYYRVRDERAVTAPGHSFGAHDYRGLEPRKREKILECLAELSRLHVVGVRAEARISPQRVVRIAFAATASAQRRHVRVSAAGIDDGSLQIRLREVRVSRRCREGAHIDEMCRAFPR